MAEKPWSTKTGQRRRDERCPVRARGNWRAGAAGRVFLSSLPDVCHKEMRGGAVVTIMKLQTMRRLLLGLLALIEAELRERGALPDRTINNRDYQHLQ